MNTTTQTETPQTESPEVLSACYAREPISGNHSLIELPLKGKINFRGDPENATVLDTIKQATELDLPVTANSSSQNSNTTIYWLGPDEWQITCSLSKVAEITTAIHSALDGIHHSAVDVSDYYTTLQLESRKSAEILSRGTPLDLHPSVFPAGSFAQTRYGHASVLLHKLSDVPVFEIQIRWSYAEYVWDYLDSTIQMLD